MATTLITNTEGWTPIEINIKFETREQLATFVAMTGYPIAVAYTVTKCSSNNSDCATRGLSHQEVVDTIGGIIDFATWSKLDKLAQPK